MAKLDDLHRTVQSPNKYSAQKLDRLTPSDPTPEHPDRRSWELHYHCRAFHSLSSKEKGLGPVAGVKPATIIVCLERR